MAFDSRASNLVPQDGNGSTSDIFIKDLKTGLVTLASIAPNGTQIPGGSYTPALTPDGRYVAFAGGDGAYLKDLRTGDLTLVACGYYYSVSISADGRFVAYDNFSSVFVKDMQTEVVTLASSALGGAPGNRGSFFSQISGNGRFVAFGSHADNLVPSDGNGHFADIFVKDLTTGDVRLVSNAQDGAAGNDAAFFSAISQDGTWIIFSSDAGNLVPGDANGNGTDFFVRNLLTDELTLLTHDDNGASSVFEPGISANGRYVTFDGRNGDYVPGDVNGVNDIFRVDLHNGPAGDVHAQVIHDPVLGDILVLTGDGGDNDISVSPLSEAGSYLVEGRFGTTLDGSAAAVAFTGIQSIRIELGSGDDSVLAEQLTIGSLEVLLGDGDDNLVVRGKYLGALTIDAGAGMDTVTLEAVTILGKTDIRMGEGDDVLSLVDAYFADDIFMDGGLDEDVLTLLGSNAFQRKVRRIRFETVR
ncbi:MAG TPA: hypothetical protein VMP01_10630 [Pirellulaceae bacterium]|nr:hypothetical protein [Pirellulaceae bacterium]